MATSYDREQYAKLDQAGEADPDRTTLLHQIFVDLEVSQYGEAYPKDISRPLATILKSKDKSNLELRELEGKKIFSVMQCLLQEVYPMNVIIGGPGQGKSTLTQFISQIHRSTFLEDESNNDNRKIPEEETKSRFTPKTSRVPFRIVLKYFAQWLTEHPKNESIESYLAEQVEKDSLEKVVPADIHEILHTVPTLVIFDGLDEVIEPELRNRLLSRISEFFRRKEQLKANAQIVATSRPTGYTGQFNPEQFWHLELQPMSDKKVREYSTKWVNVKIQSHEEQTRVLETLKECQQEEHTKLLLYTPLQVTIVLLITKDGGRPPAQREALFHEYWNTIYRREKAKAKGVIRTEESLLFELHSSLGYLLHYRAAAKNVRSLLPAEEFYQAVYAFLESKDSHSPKEDIEKLATQMVREAGERLVLLVEPEPGFFGFELRSLQEFFAAAFLTQTARDTLQRFERLKVIAPYPHWRNVALFFAGRIVRNFSGEAANILELVCRSIDREPKSRYNRWGAWLAFDVATDGAFAANRDLQYGALEYALTLLDGPVEANRHTYIMRGLQRLSPEDQRDILKPILEHKLSIIPLSSLPLALEIYGRFIGTSKFFLQGAEKLFVTNKIEYFRKSLTLCMKNGTEPNWVAKQLESYRQIWSLDIETYSEIVDIYVIDPKYVQTIFETWAPSKIQARTLIGCFIDVRRYRHISSRELHLIENPNSLTDQVILTLQCHLLKAYILQNRRTFERVKFGGDYFIRPLAKKLTEFQVEAPNVSFSLLKKFLKRQDLLEETKVLIWELYLLINVSLGDLRTQFIKDLNSFMYEQTDFMSDLEAFNPLLASIIEKHHTNPEALENQLEQYSPNEEIKVFEDIQNHLESLMRTSSKDEVSKVLFKIRIGNYEPFGKLTKDLNKYGVDPSKYTFVRSFFVGDAAKISADQLREAFLVMSNNLTDLDFVLRIYWNISRSPWRTNDRARLLGIKVLKSILDKLPNEPDLLPDFIHFSLKLLISDPKTLATFPQFLKSIGKLQENFQKRRLADYGISLLALSTSPKFFAGLAKFLNHKDENVRRGASILWASLIKSVPQFQGYESINDLRVFFSSISLDLGAPWLLLNSISSDEKDFGILLLTLTKFPFDDNSYKDVLLGYLQEAEEEQIESWSIFFRHNHSLAQARNWREILEFILSRPYAYPQEILETVLGRYIELSGDRTFQIDADFLGLPKF